MASDNESTSFTMDSVMATIKTFDTPDFATFTKELVNSLPVGELFKLIKAATNEAEKKSKTAGKVAGDTTTRKKSGSMPKGAVPPQLKKPRAWVEFTLKHALENGWEAFTVLQKKKLRGEGGQDVSLEEQIEMPGSILHNGAYIYEDSVNEKTPEGRQIIHKEAMSLSKQRKESGHVTYAEFEAQYVDETDDDKSVYSSTSSQKIVVKKTAAEKEAEAAAKKAEKEAEKAAAKAAKEAEKAAAKAAKEAEKVAAKEAKEAEAAAKKAEKEAAKKPIVKKAAVAAEPVTPIKKKETVAPSAPKKKYSAKVADE
jgi:hypothetical protein